MSRKVLFLDIDGVLNSANFLAESTGGEGVVIVDGEWNADAHLDPKLICLLNSVVAGTRCDVVLSSSWRVLFGVERTNAALKRRGATFQAVDSTPRLAGHERHVEIRRWLESQSGEIQFAIVDDDEDAGVGFGHRYVRTVDGIESKHTDRLLELLS